MRPVGTEEARGHKGERVDHRGDYRSSVKRLQREHKELLREKMEAHLVELDKAKSSYREKYEALVASSSMSASQVRWGWRGEGEAGPFSHSLLESTLCVCTASQTRGDAG